LLFPGQLCSENQPLRTAPPAIDAKDTEVIDSGFVLADRRTAAQCATGNAKDVPALAVVGGVKS